MSHSAPLIRSPQNPKLRLLRKLATRRGRKKEQKTLLVGEKIVLDAITEGLPLDCILLREAHNAPPARPGLAVLQVAASIYDPLLRELLEMDSPPPLLAIAPVPEGLGPRDWPAHPAPCAVLVACGVQDPGNLGALLRTAWYFNFAGAVLTANGAEPYSPKLQRAAIGALLRRPPRVVADLRAALELCRQAHLQPLVLDAAGGQALESYDWPSRVAILMGAEGQGFSQDELDSVSAEICKLTISGGSKAESLNVAAAFAITAHAWAAARGALSLS